jgi:hypothetical protein
MILPGDVIVGGVYRCTKTRFLREVVGERVYEGQRQIQFIRQGSSSPPERWADDVFAKRCIERVA